MKARTKTEKEIEPLSAAVTKRWKRLIVNRSRRVRWVQEKATPNVWSWMPHDRRREASHFNAWCTACCKVFHAEKAIPMRCPHCGRRLQPGRDTNSQTGHRKHEDFDYVVLAEVHGDWQLLRYFLVRTESWVGKEVEYSIPTEVVRRWMAPGRKTVVESIGMVGLGGMYRNTPWNFSGELSFKREGKGGYYSGGTSYRIDTASLARGSRFHDFLKRDGFAGIATCRKLKCELYDIPTVYFNPPMLTMLKAQRFDIVGWFLDNAEKDVNLYWPSLKVAFRAGYQIGNIGDWVDHVDLLRELNLDIHSPKYICPYNLYHEHDILLRRVERVRALKRSEQDRLNAAKYEKDYLAKKGPYLGLLFKSGGVVISTIQSVADVAAEGTAMHHCVFTNRYYAKDGSLLMSARAESGERLETIEVSLRDFSVLQSRAKFNGQSKEHAHILQMMEDHMPEIRKIFIELHKQKQEI